MSHGPDVIVVDKDGNVSCHDLKTAADIEVSDIDMAVGLGMTLPSRAMSYPHQTAGLAAIMAVIGHTNLVPVRVKRIGTPVTEAHYLQRVYLNPRTHCVKCMADIPAGKAGRMCKSCRNHVEPVRPVFVQEKTELFMASMVKEPDHGLRSEEQGAAVESGNTQDRQAT